MQQVIFQVLNMVFLLMDQVLKKPMKNKWEKQGIIIHKIKAKMVMKYKLNNKIIMHTNEKKLAIGNMLYLFMDQVIKKLMNNIFKKKEISINIIKG